MPIKLPSNIPAAETLTNEHVFFMTQERAFKQDIRPLRILILNLMPEKITTETQLFRLLGNSPLQVEPLLMYTASYQPTNVSEDHLGAFYCTFEDVHEQFFDGMIITGAPVELLAYEEVAYWSELTTIMEWSKTHVYSTMHICWGAQAGLYYHYGVKKYPLSEKMFGVFPHTVAWYSPVKLLRGFDDIFYVPHSRYTEIRAEEITPIKGLRLLSESSESGVYLVTDLKGRQIFVTGHLEYDPNTLENEYLRDLAKGLDIDIPLNYYPDDDPEQRPVVRWRSTANLLFMNWLNYYVYQETPFDLSELSHTQLETSVE